MSVPAEEVEERVRAMVAIALEKIESEMAERLRTMIEKEMCEKIKAESVVKVENIPATKLAVTEETAVARVRSIQPTRQVALKQPPMYGGTGADDRGRALKSWLSAMEAHIRLCSIDGSTASEFEIVLSYLEAHAREVADRLQVALKGQATWVDLREELNQKFGEQRSAFALLRELKLIKQSSRGVTDYALEFERTLDALLSLGWSDTLGAAMAFIDGLDELMKSKILETLLMQNDDPMSRFVGVSPSEAVRILSNLVSRREEVSSLLQSASKPASITRLAVAAAEPDARLMPGRAGGGRETSEARLLRWIR
jgi:hypothetical protein